LYLERQNGLLLASGKSLTRMSGTQIPFGNDKQEGRATISTFPHVRW
jgi:hypothetical protein